MGELKVTTLADLDLRIYEVFGALDPGEWGRQQAGLAHAPGGKNLLLDFTEGTMGAFTLDDLKAAFARTSSSPARAGGHTILVTPHADDATLFKLYKAWADRTADFPVGIEIAETRDEGLALLRRLLA